MACEAYSLCPNGGVKLFIGCTTNIQCQLHNPDTVCIGTNTLANSRIAMRALHGIRQHSRGSRPIHAAVHYLVFWRPLHTDFSTTLVSLKQQLSFHWLSLR
ncbi:hypothetical protein TELCIR_19990 [Teladorsagia circumcincta]|uniref:Uncharacterized protein n=1 Tax=Teladorsagia circumcincta TaxID=45464 RepID=A0A2G9TKS6_TELCI|nr:hypothetical protein TELCIR_19990 [Teladorsagia circumcincta]